MKKLLLLIIITIISCKKQNQSKIQIRLNESVWKVSKGFDLYKEIFICGGNSNTKIVIDSPLNDSDEIIKNDDNEFYYLTRANEVGFFEISGRIITDNDIEEFTQEILVTPIIKPIAFNAKNANNLKVNIKNEIVIHTYINSKNHQYDCNNGIVIKENGKTYLTPIRTGNCTIKIKEQLLNDEILYYEDVIFSVIE